MDGSSLALLLATLAPLPDQGTVGHGDRAIGAAARGCTITVSAHNSSDLRAVVSRDSEVRSRTGRDWTDWTKLGEAIWIGPGTRRSWTYDVPAGCGVAHHYRFLVKQFDRRDRMVGQKWISYPPEDAHGTTEREFAIGDLGAAPPGGD
ncbi:MAG: hypothetical protein AB7R55_23710 [Gemmatimonadales bacterium]